MFMIIASVISIVLVVMLAIAAVFYGGDLWTNNHYRSLYTEAENGALQIETAMHLHRGQRGIFPQGSSEEILQTLRNEEFLSSIPAGEWVIHGNIIQKPLESVDVCLRMNELAGHDVSSAEAYDGCPPCDESAYSHWTACQVAALPEEEEEG